MNSTNLQNSEQAPQAVRLAVAVNRIRARLREEAGMSDRGITISSFAMLQRLATSGPMSASALAAAEHVSQQAIAQRLDLLKPTGYIAIEQDPADRRRKLVAVTASGRALLDETVASKGDWLSRAVAAVIEDDEVPALEKAIELLDRLASADLRPQNPLR